MRCLERKGCTHAFDLQQEIPIEVRGCELEIPEEVAGKPVDRVTRRGSPPTSS